MTYNLKNTFKTVAAAVGIATLASCTPIPTEDQPLESNSRRLTQGEIEMAREVFGSEINYQRIFIKRMTTNSDRSKAVSGRIIMTDRRYEDDYSKTDNIGNIVTFMHEMTHMWQGQEGVDFFAEGIEQFIEHGFDKHGPYQYNFQDLSNFEGLGIEQQAVIVSRLVYWRLTLEEDNKDVNCNQIELHRNAIINSFPDVAPVPDMCD